MEKFKLDNILKIKKIGSELELEQASVLYNKLRLMQKHDASLGPLCRHLAQLIEQYESAHWAHESQVSEKQLRESEDAEKSVQYREQFIQKRKALIREALKAKGLIQNDLADILGHRKNYMSELINGLRPFSQEDMLIIHLVLGIKWDDLIVPIVKEPVAQRVLSVIQKLNKPNLKLKGPNLQFAS